MDKGETVERLFRRVVRALLWSLLMGGEILLLYFLPSFRLYVTSPSPIEDAFLPLLSLFVVIEFLIRLTEGTVIPYILSSARASIMIYLLYQLTGGGVYTSSLVVRGVPVEVTFQFRSVLDAFTLLLLLDLSKNVLGAVSFLHEKVEEQLKTEASF